MGDILHQPLTSSVAPILGGSSIIPIVSVLEARSHEEPHRARRHSNSLRDAHELQELDTSSSAAHPHPPALEADTSSVPLEHSPSFDTDDPSEFEHLLHDNDENDLAVAGPSHMPQKKSRSRSPNTAGKLHKTKDSLSTSSSKSPDGKANGSMNGAFRERTKHPTNLEVPDEDSADQTARLMNQRGFSLDNEDSHGADTGGKSFFELPERDRRNFLLLVLLYFLQGIPMGLAGGSIPFLLKSHLSYGQIGVYSLASYPYSLKLLWSPIVDAVWSAKVGRRKSWILPIQTLSGFGMIWLGGHAQEMMEKAGENGGAGVWGFTGWWFSLVLMCATQDIAVDGWALTLLSPANISYASTAQTVGLTAGQFLSYTVFLALSSADFANKYFRSAANHSEVGLLTLNSYLTFWGWAYLAVTLGLAILKREERTRENDSILEVYKIMGGIMKLRNIQLIIIIHLIAKIGFQANDGVTNLKLLDKGFSQEDLALTVLIDFPFEISLGYYAGKWSEQYQPITVWCWAFVGRLFAAIFAQIVVMSFPAGGTTTPYLLVVIVEHVFSTFMNTVMFVAISAFHAKIADPAIGGTYMTLLATVSNLGGTFPRFFVLKFVDLFTQATCYPPSTPPLKEALTGDLITQTFNCALEADKHRCIAGGGTCTIHRDGYYIVNILCVLVGALTFWSFIKPTALKLQALPLRAWRASS